MHGGLGNEALQLGVDGVISGALLALLGMSFALILSVTQRFHVAYIATLVVAVYGYYAISTQGHLPVAVGVIGGLLIAGLLGVGLEWGVYRVVSAGAARIGADPLIPIFVASLGVVVTVENVITLIWGSAGLPMQLIPVRGFHAGSLTVTTLGLTSLGVSVALIFGTAAFLRWAKTGRLIAGVRDNPVMAAVVGISTGTIVTVVFVLGSMMSGVIGILQASTSAANPLMGFNSMLTAFVVAFAAGTRAAPTRYLVFGVIVGEIESLATLWLNSAWSGAVLFGIVILLVSSREVRLRERLHIRSLRRQTHWPEQDVPLMLVNVVEEPERHHA